MSAAPTLERIARGEQAAVQECMSKYGGLVWTLARRLSPSRADAEDAVQEIFIELWKSAKRFDATKSSEKTFVAMIARRRLIDRLRRRSSQADTRSIPEDFDIPGETGEQVERGTEAVLATRVINELPAAQRRALLLATCEGMSHSEIADALEMPLGTVKSHVRRGLAAVRQRLEVGGSPAAGRATS